MGNVGSSLGKVGRMEGAAKQRVGTHLVLIKHVTPYVFEILVLG